MFAFFIGNVVVVVAQRHQIETPSGFLVSDGASVPSELIRERMAGLPRVVEDI